MKLQALRASLRSLADYCRHRSRKIRRAILCASFVLSVGGCALVLTSAAAGSAALVDNKSVKSFTTSTSLAERANVVAFVVANLAGLVGFFSHDHMFRVLRFVFYGMFSAIATTSYVNLDAVRYFVLNRWTEGDGGTSYVAGICLCYVALTITCLAGNIHSESRYETSRNSAAVAFLSLAFLLTVIACGLWMSRSETAKYQLLNVNSVPAALVSVLITSGGAAFKNVDSARASLFLIALSGFWDLSVVLVWKGLDADARETTSLGLSWGANIAMLVSSVLVLYHHPENSAEPRLIDEQQTFEQRHTTIKRVYMNMATFLLTAATIMVFSTDNPALYLWITSNPNDPGNAPPNWSVVHFTDIVYSVVLLLMLGIWICPRNYHASILRYLLLGCVAYVFVKSSQSATAVVINMTNAMGHYSSPDPYTDDDTDGIFPIAQDRAGMLAAGEIAGMLGCLLALASIRGSSRIAYTKGIAWITVILVLLTFSLVLPASHRNSIAVINSTIQLLVIPAITSVLFLIGGIWYTASMEFVHASQFLLGFTAYWTFPNMAELTEATSFPVITVWASGVLAFLATVMSIVPAVLASKADIEDMKRKMLDSRITMCADPVGIPPGSARSVAGNALPLKLAADFRHARTPHPRNEDTDPLLSVDSSA
eukprot:m.184958 g.184958  ORF g.184958 m.184958 type:complete len:654 (+) comp53532_c0_seq2:274-2235(+)